MKEKRKRIRFSSYNQGRAKGNEVMVSLNQAKLAVAELVKSRLLLEFAEAERRARQG